MRHAKMRDRNHAEIRDALRRVPGVWVRDTADLGYGHSDLLVCVRGRILWVEIKDGEAIPSKRRLTPAEEDFRAFVGANYHVVETKAEALSLILGVMP